MPRSLVVSLIIALGSAEIASAQSRSEIVWTAAGGGVGFGLGLWAGLTAFDDAVNSDRKVWTSAIVGAGVGAVAGYLIGRARTDRSRPAKAVNEMRRGQHAAAERRLLEALAKSFRFTNRTCTSRHEDGDPRQPSSPQVAERDVGVGQRIDLNVHAQRNGRRQREKLFRVAACEVGDRSNGAFFP